MRSDTRLMHIVIVGKIVGIGQVDHLSAGIRQVERYLFLAALFSCISIGKIQVIIFFFR